MTTTTKTAASTAAVPAPADAQEHLETNLLQSSGWVADEYAVRPTQDGRKRIFINIQFSKDGKYGARKQLSISNRKDDAILDRFLEQHEADDRLFAFKAFETVWHAKDGTRCSTWQVMDIISLRPQAEVADHTPEQPVVPTQEEINF